MPVVPLESIAEILPGYQSRTGVAASPEGTHCLVFAKDFESSDYLRWGSLLRFCPERDPEPYMIRRDDILFQAKGSEHSAFWVPEPLKDTLASGSFHIIRPMDKRVSSEYIAWWLNQAPAQRYLQAESQSTSIASVSKASLLRLQVQIPPVETQNMITKITRLAHREAQLRRSLADARLKLAAALCLAATQKEGLQ